MAGVPRLDRMRGGEVCRGRVASDVGVAGRIYGYSLDKVGPGSTEVRGVDERPPVRGQLGNEALPIGGGVDCIRAIDGLERVRRREVERTAAPGDVGTTDGIDCNRRRFVHAA